MPNVNLGPFFETFVSQKISEGRFQNVSEVVRAGLRLLQDHESDRAEQAARLAREINMSFDAGEPSRLLNDVFDGLEAKFEKDMAAKQ
jgi:antitoxin ParD1/3/4